LVLSYPGGTLKPESGPAVRCPVSGSRYLTTAEKTAELDGWRRTRDAFAGIVGPGVPDPEMIPWCEKINALPGVCTLQSCSGHPDGEIPRLGHLWLRLDDRRAASFHARAFELAAKTGIERISLIYQPWGHEVIQLEFAGSPDGQLEGSLGAILGFLGSL
jgi:hypothetical protein